MSGNSQPGRAPTTSDSNLGTRLTLQPIPKGSGCRPRGPGGPDEAIGARAGHTQLHALDQASAAQLFLDQGRAPDQHAETRDCGFDREIVVVEYDALRWQQLRLSHY